MQVQPGIFLLKVSEIKRKLLLQNWWFELNILVLAIIKYYAIWKATQKATQTSNDSVSRPIHTNDFGTFPRVLMFFECFSLAIRILCLLGILFQAQVFTITREKANSWLLVNLATIHCRLLTYAKRARWGYPYAKTTQQFKLNLF